MALFDLLGRRWALRVVWELRDAGVVTLAAEGGYRLTDEGLALVEALAPLHTWAERWRRRA